MVTFVSLSAECFCPFHHPESSGNRLFPAGVLRQKSLSDVKSDTTEQAVYEAAHGFHFCF